MAFFGCFMFFGSFIAYWGVGKALAKSDAFAKNPTATGIIKKSQVTGSGKSYGIAVEYEYTVAGKKYVCNKIQTMEYTYSTAQSAAEELKKYPVGKSVTVYHDPADPSNACLDVSRSSIAYIGPILLTIVGALLMFLFYLTRR